MDNEIWKPIPGYEEYYEVSSLGRVRRIQGGLGARVNLKGSLTDGYFRVNLKINSESKNFAIHRLVAQTFIPNPENKPQVNHIDGNKQNNAVSNLEWVTAQENVMHAWKTGLYKPTRGMTGKHHTEKARKRIGETSKGRHHSKETLEKISEAKKGKIYVNNGTECHTASPEKLQEYLDNGYVLGKIKKNKTNFRPLIRTLYRQITG